MSCTLYQRTDLKSVLLTMEPYSRTAISDIKYWLNIHLIVKAVFLDQQKCFQQVFCRLQSRRISFKDGMAPPPPFEVRNKNPSIHVHLKNLTVLSIQFLRSLHRKISSFASRPNKPLVCYKVPE